MKKASSLLFLLAILINFFGCTVKKNYEYLKDTSAIYKNEKDSEYMKKPVPNEDIHMVYIKHTVIDESYHLEFIKKAVFDVIANKFENNSENNISLLRIMYDKTLNRYWVEFYDTKSFLSSLWMGFVAVDATSNEIIHIDSNIRLFSGISPEMAAEFRRAGSELQNEYGNFQRFKPGQLVE